MGLSNRDYIGIVDWVTFSLAEAGVLTAEQRNTALEAVTRVEREAQAKREVEKARKHDRDYARAVARWAELREQHPDVEPENPGSWLCSLGRHKPRVKQVTPDPPAKGDSLRTFRLGVLNEKNDEVTLMCPRCGDRKRGSLW